MSAGRVISASLGAVAAAAICLPARADVAVEGVEDEALRDRMIAILPDADDPENRVEARRIATEAADRITALLRSEGYYSAQVEARTRGEEEFEPVVSVTLGERFTVTTLNYVVEGGAAARDAAMPEAPADALLSTGDPLRADDVIAEEAGSVARLRAKGYPDATPDPRRVVVDHATSGSDVTFNIAAGRPATLGEVMLDTDARVREGWLRRIVPFEAGEQYEPIKMETLSTRLSGTGAFDTVTVRLAPSEPGEGVEQRDVIVELDEGDRHTIELGAGYATSDGVRLEAEWARRNMFGGAETLTLTSVAASMERSLAAEIRAPHFFHPGRTAIAGVQAIQEETDAYDRLAAIVAAGAEQPLSETLSAGVGISLERSRVEDRVSGERDFNLFTGYGELRYDDTGDLLDPKEGMRASLRLEPGLTTGDDDLTYLKAIVSVSAYQKVTDSPEVILAGRVRAGTVTGAMADDLPADRRFYSGGGGSVRGYAYQSLGPRDAENNPLGGRSLLEMSAEARFRVFGNFGGAVFVDAGATKRGEVPGFEDMRFGAGAGVRYYTGFGPIRADVAIPLNPRDGDRGFELYLSIGQAF